MKRTKIAAIDVGTTKVCTVMADIDRNDILRIVGVGVAPSFGLQKGLVVSVNEAKESIRESVRAAERVAGYRLELAYVGVTGRHITSVNNHGVVAITRNDMMVRPDDLRRVLQAARNVEIPSGQRLLHVIPRNYIIDGQQGIENPVGMHGFRLDLDAHIVTAAIASIQNLTKCIRGVGVEIEDLVLEPLASAEAILTDEEKDRGVIVADIGGGTTDIAVFKDNTIFHTAVLPVAGYQITRDISIGLGLSFELAEEMKKKYGNVDPAYKDVNASDKILAANGHNVSYGDLSEVIRVRVEELLSLVVMELPRSESTRFVPGGLVLTGGSANLPGIAELSYDLTRLPVRVGVPFPFYGVSDRLLNPAYATSVGLLIWKRRNQGAKSWKARGGINQIFSQLSHVFAKKSVESIESEE
jgi:cell division protein FtsA